MPEPAEMEDIPDLHVPLGKHERQEPNNLTHQKFLCPSPFASLNTIRPN